MELPNVYEGKHYKKLVIIPLVLILLSLFYIPQIQKGVDLKGGSLITIVTDAPSDSLEQKRIELKEALAKFSSDVTVRSFDNPSGRGYEIEVGTSASFDDAESKIAALKTADAVLGNEMVLLQFMEVNELDAAKLEEQKRKVDLLEKALIEDVNTVLLGLGSEKTATGSRNAVELAEEEYQLLTSQRREELIAQIKQVVPVKSYSTKEIGASLSRFFLSKTAEIVVVSLLLAGLFVVVIFRGKVATLAVLFGAFADLIITAGAMGLLGIPLSLATVAALLMLIGFSIDTDMLLTIRALKRTEGTVRERVYDAMRTAIVMNTSAISAFGVLVLVSLLLRVETYYQIGMVAVIGGLIDFIATWCGNAVMIMWYAEIKGEGSK